MTPAGLLTYFGLKTDDSISAQSHHPSMPIVEHIMPYVFSCYEPVNIHQRVPTQIW